MTPELREACRRALHVLTAEGTLLRAGRAALFVLERTTPGWRIFARASRHPPLVWCVELGYWIVANNRSFFAKLLLRTH
jgi:predicted DCC family thiol-disulfide oxidoreductase YuxK